MFFNILYSLLNILSVGTMLPILGLMFGTIEKQGREPVWNGELGTYFNYIKDKAYYFVQIQIDQHGAVQVLAVLCAITGVSFLLRNIFRYIGSFLLVNYRVGITKDLRTAMYNKFLQLPVSFFTEQRKGDMMSRISNDIGGVEGGIMGVLVDIINAPFMIISSLIALFLLSPQLTLFSLVVFPGDGLADLMDRKKLKKTGSLCSGRAWKSFFAGRRNFKIV
ncbi:Lipid A export ATP-binding/permease protein MsbA [Chryseobacterium carnipullorum]|uniref:Lipid A export ATP-binding/permease protein MsbA n=1 Tax=Chryseobacterium carnipullorum TaxID=1124835 RepID=A0A376EJY5_CHRCU|nr:Lipid A export ATP-binding/permease protein MsbA [Chryseobacterium carnipullorum]